MSTFTSLLTFVTVTCYKCGVEFGVPIQFRAERLADGASFFCPNGHSQAYVESETAKLQKQLERERSNTQWYREAYEARGEKLTSERNRVNAYRGVITKTKKRIQNGVCPCCNRTFQDLARHMQSQHPGYAE